MIHGIGNKKIQVAILVQLLEYLINIYLLNPMKISILISNHNNMSFTIEVMFKLIFSKKRIVKCP